MCGDVNPEKTDSLSRRAGKVVSVESERTESLSTAASLELVILIDQGLFCSELGLVQHGVVFHCGFQR